MEDDGVDILVEEIWVTEEGLELWVDPVLLEVGGGEVELEDRVLKVLTEEGESDVGLEEGVTDELVKAQDRDSVESLNVILVLLTPDVVKEVSEPCLLCVLPEEGVVQETGGRGLVKGLGSNAGCEEGDSDLKDKIYKLFTLLNDGKLLLYKFYGLLRNFGIFPSGIY